MRLAVLLLLAAAPIWAQVALVHAGTDVAELSFSRVRDMLLGRVTTWEDGKPVAIILVDDAAVDASLIRVVGRDHSRLMRGWKRLVYSGGGSMPLLVGSIAEAREAVARRPGSLALVATAVEDPRLRHLPLTAE